MFNFSIFEEEAYNRMFDLQLNQIIAKNPLNEKRRSEINVDTI